MTRSISPVNDLAIRDIDMALNVLDKRAAQRWYADKLGVRFEHEESLLAGRRLKLCEFGDATSGSHTVYQVVTADLGRAHATLEAAGVKVSPIDRGCWNFDFSDPWGNKWGFFSPFDWLEDELAPYPGEPATPAPARAPICPVRDLGIRELETNLLVRDHQAAIAWYTEAFGFRFDKYGRTDMVGRAVILWGFPDAAAPSHAIAHVVTADLRRAHAALAAAGVEVGAMNSSEAAFELADPWSNRWRFQQLD